MSDTPQGPDWWLASDGKYYPPQNAAPPPAAPPPAPPAPPMGGYQQPMGAPMGGYQQPMYQAPMAVQPMAPQKKKGNGCLWAALIVAVLIIGSIVAVFFVVGRAVNDALNCSSISDKDAKEVFGSEVTMFQQGSALIPTGFNLDERILPNEKSCVISRTGTGTGGQPVLGSVLKIDKPDAAAFFKAELDKAKAGTNPTPTTSTTEPITLPNGDTLTIPTISVPGGLSGDPYYFKDVSLGDEAFCTKANFFDASGLLVRKGNTIVYTTVTAAGSSQDFSQSNCDYNLKLAQKALG